MTNYWARSEARARCSIDRLNFSSWFDFWHTHIDWNGRGNSQLGNRQDVAAATIRLLNYLELRAQDRREPIQLWATICDNTMDNAVYAHSPNPNRDSYPNDFKGTQWDASIPDWLAAVVHGGKFEVGAYLGPYSDGAVYMVRKRI
jgi:hypothetical protein